jgi:hypothetical protein
VLSSIAKCSQNGNLEIKPGTALRLCTHAPGTAQAGTVLSDQSLGPGKLLLLSPTPSPLMSGLPGRWVDGVRWVQPLEGSCCSPSCLASCSSSPGHSSSLYLSCQSSVLFCSNLVPHPTGSRGLREQGSQALPVLYWGPKRQGAGVRSAESVTKCPHPSSPLDCLLAQRPEHIHSSDSFFLLLVFIQL